MALQTHPLHPLFGVEITGIDITGPLDDGAFAEIRAPLDVRTKETPPVRHAVVRETRDKPAIPD